MQQHEQKTKDQPKSESKTDYCLKKQVLLPDLLPSLFFGTSMLFLNLIDLSVCRFALDLPTTGSSSSSVDALSFLSLYLQWKASSPYLSWYRVFVKCLLPFLLFAIGRDFLQIATRKASLVRNMVDLLNLPVLLGLVYIMLTSVEPLERALRAATPDRSLAQQLFQPYLIVFGCNVLMFLFPIFRFKADQAFAIKLGLNKIKSM